MNTAPIANGSTHEPYLASFTGKIDHWRINYMGMNISKF
jgi:hypothetical protein